MSSNPPEKPVMAAAISLSSDEDTARRLQAVEQLVSIFGFAQPVAQQAIEAVGCDVTEAYNYILDNGLGTDQGGPVTPISNCPHVESLLQISLEQLPETPQTTVCSHYHDHIRNSTNNNNNNHHHQTGQLKSETDPTGHCPSHENWLCLTCGCTRCSRYVNGHGLEHWKATSCTAAAMRSNNNNNNNNNNDSDDVSSVVGHALAVSLADLSVWCHACQSYLASHQIPLLRPLIQRLEELKFQQPPPPPPPLSKKQKVTRGDEQVVVEPNQKDEEKETKSDDNDAEEDESKSGGDNGAKETHFADDDSDEDEDDQGAFELDLTGPNGRNILNMIRAAAASQGIPIELILQGAQFDLDDDDDEEEVEYPFEQRPNSLEDLAKFIQSDNCKRIVILAGAGMSVASGIPDFRSADGLYATMDPDLITATEAQRQKMRVDPSSALDQPLFLENPLPCLELNRDFILGTRNQKWKATLAHRFVELLHTKLGNKLVRLYTQNIDGLEDQCTKLPRDKVIAVHGSMDRAECALCKSESDIDDFADKVKTQIKDLSRQDPEAPTDSTPIVCSVCGCSTMKPAIVLFRSSLPTAFFDNVPDDVQDVDLLIVIGTSLRVAPANSIVWRVPRSALRVLVNRDPQGEHLGMNFDESESKRDFFAAGDCESTFLELMDHLGWTNELGSLLNHHQLPDSSAELLKERLAQLGEATGTENGDNDT